LNNKNEKKKPRPERQARSARSVLSAHEHPTPAPALHPHIMRARAVCIRCPPTPAPPARTPSILCCSNSTRTSAAEMFWPWSSSFTARIVPPGTCHGERGMHSCRGVYQAYPCTSDGLTWICDASEDPLGRGLAYATLRTACGACAVANDTRIHSTKGGTRYKQWRRVDRSPWVSVGVRGRDSGCVGLLARSNISTHRLWMRVPRADGRRARNKAQGADEDTSRADEEHVERGPRREQRARLVFVLAPHAAQRS
jgi:hypothetical protein